MKFSDYEASHITPQMTLLKKINEILKFLRTADINQITRKLYLHTITFTDSNEDEHIVRYISEFELPFTEISYDNPIPFAEKLLFMALIVNYNNAYRIISTRPVGATKFKLMMKDENSENCLIDSDEVEEL